MTPPKLRSPGSWTVKRVTAWSRGAELENMNPATTTATAATAHGSQRKDLDSASVSGESSFRASSIAIRASPMSRRRRLGLRSRHRPITVRKAFGVLGGNASKSIASRSTAASTCATDSPLKTGRPTSISQSTMPNDQMSLRLSTVFALACSGDIYAAVPRMTPAAEARVSVGDCERSTVALSFRASALASQKSRTFMFPSRVIMMLAGFRSRWTMPFSCASSSASAI